MLIQTISVGLGLIVTLFLGWFCECFLKKSVIAQPESPDFQGPPEAGGGGKQLGTLERLLFFTSFWLGEYTVAAGWLAFKVAAKWAAWQHVAKLPDTVKNLNDRFKLSSRLLGRFNNGTLYNGLWEGKDAPKGVLIPMARGYCLR